LLRSTEVSNHPQDADTDHPDMVKRSLRPNEPEGLPALLNRPLSIAVSSDLRA
jgi:hypothetical protein